MVLIRNPKIHAQARTKKNPGSECSIKSATKKADAFLGKTHPMGTNSVNLRKFIKRELQ